jgi:hypothetical protein
MNDYEFVLLDTSFIKAVPRDQIDTASSTSALLFVTKQGMTECNEKNLRLPNNTSEQRGYGWEDFFEWEDFDKNGHGFFTLANSAERTVIQIQRGDVGRRIRLDCGCNVYSVAWVSSDLRTETYYLCRDVAEDKVDFSYFVATTLNSTTKTVTFDKHLGFALDDRALFGGNIVNARPWSEVSPHLLKEIELGRAAFNNVTSTVLDDAQT